MAFLSLPTELRLAVYAIMAVPDVVPFSAYRGLYMSCHQIQDEMNKECAKVLGAYLRRVEASLKATTLLVEITIPDTFLAMQHICLTFDDNEDAPRDLPPDLRALAALHLESIKIVANEASLRTRSTLLMTKYLHGLSKAFISTTSFPAINVRRLAIEAIMPYDRVANIWMNFIYNGYYDPRYRIRVVAAERRVIAVWELNEVPTWARAGHDTSDRDEVQILQGIQKVGISGVKMAWARTCMS